MKAPLLIGENKYIGKYTFLYAITNIFKEGKIFYITLITKDIFIIIISLSLFSVELNVAVLGRS